jgi:transcription initiation factor TFIIIB Brf1 subunit/transcription initiation factor TFIIB
MIKKCPDCGSLNVEEAFEGESYCKDCFLHCATADLEDASVFDQITQSMDVLAEKLVFPLHDGWWMSTVIYDGSRFATKPEAIAATVAKLKEVAE